MKKLVVFLFLSVLLDGCAATSKEKTAMTMQELLNMPTEELLNVSVQQEKKKH